MQSRRRQSGEKKKEQQTNDDKVLAKRRLFEDEGVTSRNLGTAKGWGEEEIVRTISELGKELSDLEAEIARGGSDQLRETMLHLREEIASYEKRLDSMEERKIAEKQRKRRPLSEQSLAKYISSLEKEIAGHEARLATRLKPVLASSLGNTISRLKKKLSWYLTKLAGRKNGSKAGDELARKISALERDISWHEKRPLANAVSKLDDEIMWHEGRHKIIPDSTTPNGHSYGYQKSNGALTWISSLFGKRPKPQEELAQSISEIESEIEWHEGRLEGRKAEARFSTGGTSENLADSISQLEKEIEWHEQVQDLEREVVEHEQRLAENHQPQRKTESEENLARSISQLEKEVELQEQAQQLENEIGWHERRLAGKSRLGNSGVITEEPETWTFSKRRGDMGESTKGQHAISRRTGEGKEVGGEAGKITRSNFWKLPHFATSTDTGRGRAFNWVGSGAQGQPS